LRNTSARPWGSTTCSYNWSAVPKGVDVVAADHLQELGVDQMLHEVFSRG